MTVDHDVGRAAATVAANQRLNVCAGACVLCVVLLVGAGCAGLKKHGSTAEARGQRSESGRARSDDALTESVLVGEAGAEQREQSPVTVMFINGDAITAEDVIRPVLDELKERAGVMPAQRYRQFLVDMLGARIRIEARDRLLYQEACKRVVEQEWERIDQYVDHQIRDVVNKEYQGRQTRYEKALARQGLSVEEDRERIRRQAVVQLYLTETVGRRVMTPTRRELWQYFQERKDDMTRPSRREMFLIEVTKNVPLDAVTANDGSKVPLDASTAIRLAKGELVAGASFDEVAKKYSTGVHASEGGRWGFVTRDSVRERWQLAVDALFGLAHGELSEVIETDDAYFIVKCGEIDAGLAADFEAMQPELIRSYREHQFNVLVEELVVELQAKATIQPRDLSRFLRAAVEAAPRPAGR